MKGELHITETEKAEGMRVVLMDDKNTPCARYEFAGEKLNDIERIQYHSNNNKIYFASVIPSTISEITTLQ